MGLKELILNLINLNLNSYMWLVATVLNSSVLDTMTFLVPTDFSQPDFMKIQWPTCQITHDIFHRTRTNNPKIHLEPQKAKLPKQSEEKESRRHHPLRLQKNLKDAAISSLNCCC